MTKDTGRKHWLSCWLSCFSPCCQKTKTLDEVVQETLRREGYEGYTTPQRLRAEQGRREDIEDNRSTTSSLPEAQESLVPTQEVRVRTSEPSELQDVSNIIVGGPSPPQPHRQRQRSRRQLRSHPILTTEREIAEAEGELRPAPVRNVSARTSSHTDWPSSQMDKERGKQAKKEKKLEKEVKGEGQHRLIQPMSGIPSTKLIGLWGERPIMFKLMLGALVVVSVLKAVKARFFGGNNRNNKRPF
jgi:hypothetical protein